jgi:hypothetical protein
MFFVSLIIRVFNNSDFSFNGKHFYRSGKSNGFVADLFTIVWVYDTSRAILLFHGEIFCAITRK